MTRTDCLVNWMLVGLLSLGAAGCKSAKHKGPGRVHDSKHKFSIVPPAAWTSKGEFGGAFMTYAGPQEGEFTVNFNVNVQIDTATPQQALPLVKAYLAKIVTAYEPVDEGFTTIDGKKALYLCTKFRAGQFKLQNLQYAIFTGTKVYTITFTAPQDVFAKYKPTFEKVGQSARIG